MPNLTPPTPSRRVVLAGLLLACLGEAIGYPLLKAFDLLSGVAAPGASSWFVSAVLLGARFLGAAIALLMVTRSRPTRDEAAQGLWLGVFACAGTVLLVDGMNFCDTSTSAFLSQGYVVILPLLSAIACRRWPLPRVLAAVLISMTGLAVLARVDPLALRLGRGEAEVLLSACAFAGQIFSISRARYQQNRSGPVSLVMFGCAGLLALPIALATRRSGDFSALSAAPGFWLFIALITLVATLVPMWLMNRYQRYVSSAEAGVIYGAEPVLASCLALFCPEWLAPIAHAPYANEHLSLRLLLGGILVLFANFLLQTRSAPQQELLSVLP